MKTKVNYLRKYNDTNTYSQTINVICNNKRVKTDRNTILNIKIQW